MYPLERAFFYIQKPPTLLVHDEIESVEFLRQGGGMLAASAKTFDLSIRMQGDQVCYIETPQTSLLTLLLTVLVNVPALCTKCTSESVLNADIVTFCLSLR